MTDISSVQTETTTTSAVLPTSTVSSIYDVGITMEHTKTETTSSELSVSINTSDSAISTTEVATTEVATTTTSDAAWEPIPTFGLFARGSRVDGEYLEGPREPSNYMGWDVESVGGASPLVFSIQPNTNYVREASLYFWCVAYADAGQLSPLVLCPIDWFDSYAYYGALTCEQTADKKVHCSTPAVQCTSNDLTTERECTSLPGKFDQFYVYSGPMNQVYLAIGSAENSPAGNGIQLLSWESKRTGPDLSLNASREK